MLVNKPTFYMKLSVLKWCSADKYWRLKKDGVYVISKFSDQYGILCIMYKTLSFVECVWMTHLRGHLWRGNIHSVLISGMYYLPRRGFFLACFKQLLSCACGLSVPYSVCLHHLSRHKQTHYATDKPSINWLCKY